MNAINNANLVIYCWDDGDTNDSYCKVEPDGSYCSPSIDSMPALTFIIDFTVMYDNTL